MRRAISWIVTILLIGILAMPAYAEQTLQITGQPMNPAVTDGGYAEYSVTVEGENVECTWILEYGDNAYDLSYDGRWKEYVKRGVGFSQEGNTFTCCFDGISKDLSGSTLYAKLTDGTHTVLSDRSVISVSGKAAPPKAVASVSQEVMQGQYVSIFCDATTDQKVSYKWLESKTGALRDATAIDGGTQTKNVLVCDTSTPGSRFYTCRVESANGGVLYTNLIRITVLKEAEPETTAPQVTEPAWEEAPADWTFLKILIISLILLAVITAAVLVAWKLQRR